MCFLTYFNTYKTQNNFDNLLIIQLHFAMRLKEDYLVEDSRLFFRFTTISKYLEIIMS
jgi:hypothetical protein